LQRLNIARTASRRAVEALRAGVPNRDAVSQLGCSQPEIEQKFLTMLHDSLEKRDAQQQAYGLIVSGDFGSGKSHLLQYLEHLSLENGYVASKLVISKETSLADPAKLFRAAIEQARVPGKLGSAINNVASALHYNSDRYRDFSLWAASPESHLAAQFPASLYVYEYGGDLEFSNSIIRFWSGDPLTTRELRGKLRELGQQSTYDIGRLPNAGELAMQRFRFATRLMIAAGYEGWVLLIDEAELIAQYTFKQRAKAYAELARWMGRLDDLENGIFPGLATVVALTPDFDAKVIQYQGDRPGDEELVPGRLRASPRDEDALLATLAVRGMRLISQQRQPLSPLTAERVQQTFEELRKIYSEAFQWPAPRIELGFSGQASAVMRPLVRRWITEWDIRRMYPGSSFEPEVTPLLPPSYEEDPDVEPSDTPATE